MNENNDISGGHVIGEGEVLEPKLLVKGQIMEESNDSKKITISPIPEKESSSLNISDLSPEQKIAYHKYSQGANLFITGPGGTGKTRLIKNFVDFSNSINNPVAVCAMTGCAAILLNCNARTLHSWSGIKLAKGPKSKIIDAVLKNRNSMKTWRRAKVLILDEVSMLSKKIFELIEEIARIVRRSTAPFGGLQVVFTGDFYQLPPVGTDGEPDTERFCFESVVWNQVFKMENHIELKTIFRQTDPLYIEILMQIRKGELAEDNKKILQSYVNRLYDPANHNGCVPTKLFPLRAKADYVNTMMFSKIKEKEFIFEAKRKTDCRTNLESNKGLTPDMLDKCARIDSTEINYEIDQLLNNTACSQILRLKKGAAVMCTVNLDMDKSICNGAQGIVLNIIENGTEPLIIVKFSNGVIKTISPHYWQSDEYATLAVGQYPLCLAWALTIHKIQGATLEMAEIDIGQSVFEYGQTYVALSRIQSLNGLYLSAFHAQKIMANLIVKQFYTSISDVPRSETTLTTETTTSSVLDFEKYTCNADNIKIVRL